MSKNNPNLDFIVTVELYCPNMIDRESFAEEFENNPAKAFRVISDDYAEMLGMYESLAVKNVRVAELVEGEK